MKVFVGNRFRDIFLDIINLTKMILIVIDCNLKYINGTKDRPVIKTL